MKRIKSNPLEVEEFILSNNRCVMYSHNADEIWLELNPEEQDEIIECLKDNDLSWALTENERKFVKLKDLRKICHDKDRSVIESLIETVERQLYKLVEN